ncbi:hypothetical protein J7E99_30405 [Streptomyces sp. ISL-44]|uniref:hypothetical protein n=1 Tax=Streptomyces sp. ISL-44 TaxID=2819184 RepID=UPI001BECD238|nr:hypothetical protein [Streptomyces sp. ISL-44]MBT2544904.1 hypothetical protein [Streptomyces sp. ISL-44]
MLRRIVAGLAAIVLVAEAVVLVFVHIVLGRTTANQSMSIAGSDPDVMSKATYGLGAGMGAFLLLCAVLVGAAVTHGVLGILSVVLVGWGAFVVMMLILCLLVLTLMLYAAPRETGVQDAPPPLGELKPTNP